MKKTHLLIIDPQNDFAIANEFDYMKLNADAYASVKQYEHHGTLVVNGADNDMERIAAFITTHNTQINEITCTLDSHQMIHIAHPIFWVNSNGEHPKPFTLITDEDVRNKTWRAFHTGLQEYAQNYVDTLKKINRNTLCIWNPHCLIGTWGHSIVGNVAESLLEWETKTLNRVNYIAKGSNFLTEHYSAIKADVPYDSDPTTKLNTNLIEVLNEADEILIAGIALSHCVKWTVTDIADNIGEDNINKLILLEDTSSSVSGFETDGQKFIEEMTARGMRKILTTNWN